MTDREDTFGRDWQEARFLEFSTIFREQFTMPWKWSTKVVQFCWTKNTGILEHWRVFEEVSGETLIKEVDVKWMEDRGIPYGAAATAFIDIERMRTNYVPTRGWFSRFFGV
ncbi:MAG: hypothetical protein WC732_08505 [Candidatus Omnitrophota bacterium]